jgi:hypothetical protein
MVKRVLKPWVNDMTPSPKISGNLEISKFPTGIFIGGDPEALRSFAKLLTWLADVDQESLAAMPKEERYHVHLHANGPKAFACLTRFSEETELCRLDAKGTGAFPDKYRAARNRGPRDISNTRRRTRDTDKRAGRKGG